MTRFISGLLTIMLLAFSLRVAAVSCKATPNEKPAASPNDTVETDSTSGQIPSIAAEASIPGDGEISVDAYGKTKLEDEFKIAGLATPVTGANLALGSFNLASPETFKCSITVSKANLDNFTISDVVSSQNVACQPLSSPATGFYFKVSGITLNTLYVATLGVVSDNSQNTVTQYKVLLPPINDDCRNGNAQFTLIADALTTGAADLMLELLKQADPGLASPNSGAQVTLRNLNVPDLMHFAAASTKNLVSAATSYALIYSGMYTSTLGSPGLDFNDHVCKAFVNSLLHLGTIKENSDIYARSSGIEAWKAITIIAADLSVAISDMYSVYLSSGDISYPFISTIVAEFNLNPNALAANIVSSYDGHLTDNKSAIQIDPSSSSSSSSSAGP